VTSGTSPNISQNAGKAFWTEWPVTIFIVAPLFFHDEQ
jgi:hypothetical protein